MKVIVGLDDSPCSEVVLKHITSDPWPKDTRFIVLSSAAPIFVGPGEAAGSDAIGRLMEGQEKYHREIAENGAARLNKAGLMAEARAIVSDPRSALIGAARAERADLIVVGSHGRRGIQKLLIGSVASHVVTNAPCSVLVIREGGGHD